MTTPWQPTLKGKLVSARPLRPDDFDALWAVGSDPIIWEQHPESDRWREDKFRRFFDSGITSGGALAVLDAATGKLIGTSRFTGHDAAASAVEIGYTFFSRSCWGKGHNEELKALMLAHAFRHVDKAQFFVGESNFRSRRAMEKLGAQLIGRDERPASASNPFTSVVYEIRREDWNACPK